MNRFWFATFQLHPEEDLAVGPISTADSQFLAVEVLNSGTDWAVLFSTVDDVAQPTAVQCVIGFTNVAKACNLWLDRGFPLVDASINLDSTGALTLVSPNFAGDHSVMDYEKALFSVSGVDPSEPGTSAGSLDTTYSQFFQTPDAVQPDTLVARVRHDWRPVRRHVRALAVSQLPTLDFNFGTIEARYPSLAPLDRGPLTPHALWVGELDLPAPPLPDEVRPKLPPDKVPPVFGAPAFRFENVEILGFRIDPRAFGVDDIGPELARLVAPLNFHLQDATTESDPYSSVTPDFRYRAATPTIVIELIRYGRMKARDPQPPMRIDDSQSQHELLVRLLVGRVDDDSAQAHDPATFSPAIFVDNPWSKGLGRDSVGYDKRLMACWSDGDRLLPDGRRMRKAPGADAETMTAPLGSISRITLVDRTGGDVGPTLMEFSYSSKEHEDPFALLPIDLDLTFGTSILSNTRWRQTDFADGEFRRSFSQLAIADSVRSFRSIQPAPVGRRLGLDPAWVTGTFLLDPDIRAALPFGTATLTLYPRANLPHDSSPAPHAAWNQLCGLLAGLDSSMSASNTSPATVMVLPGSWYRLFCSMDLTIDDGLDWSPWRSAGHRVAKP